MRSKQLQHACLSAVMCALLLAFGTACSTTYKTEIRRGDLLRTVPAGRPEATGHVSLDVKGELRGPSTLDLTVAKLIHRHRPVRREFAQDKVRHQVSLTPEGAVSGELANLMTTLGFGHFLFWDWGLGLPKTQCLPKETASDECRFEETVQALDGVETEEALERSDPEVISSRLGDVSLSLKLKSTARGDVQAVWGGYPDSRGRITLDLGRLIPRDESRMLLEVAASHPDAEDGRFAGLIVGEGGRFLLDSSSLAVADARKSIAEGQEAREVELARRAAEREEAARKAAEQRRLQREKQRDREIAKLCPKGLFGFYDLLEVNPYDVKGKCFDFIGSHLQTLSRSKALFFVQLQSGGKTYLLDFGDKAAPGGFFQGVAKGVDAFEYETAMGAARIVPSLRVVELPAPVPASAR